MSKRPAKNLIIAGVVVIALAAWLLLKAAPDKDKANQVPAVVVTLAPVTQQDVPLTIQAVGTVIPTQTVGVRSRLDSQIMEVKFHDGDTVKKGDVLFVLDDRTLRAQLAQAQATLDNATRQYDRVTKLAAQGYAARADQDNARAAFDAAKAAVDSINVQLGYSVITAPIDGRTGAVAVTVGNTVKANDTGTLVTINQIQPILVQASLPQAAFERVVDALRAGKVAATITRDGTTGAEQGVLQFIDNTIDQTTGTFATRSAFDNADGHLWPGMLGTLTIEIGLYKDAVVVPEVAVQHNSGAADFVYTIAGGKAHKQEIKVVEILGGRAIVTAGLRPGQQVAVDGMMSLKDGSAVTTPAAVPSVPKSTAKADHS